MALGSGKVEDALFLRRSFGNHPAKQAQSLKRFQALFTNNKANRAFSALSKTFGGKTIKGEIKMTLVQFIAKFGTHGGTLIISNVVLHSDRKDFQKEAHTSTNVSSPSLNFFLRVWRERNFPHA
jgi:hypothetical protein